MDNLAVGLFVTAAIFFLVFMAGALSDAYKDERAKCPKDIPPWGATKYVCVVNKQK